MKKLVPPLELCKQIPQREFVDSALMWVALGKDLWRLRDRDQYCLSEIAELERNAWCYAAPTAEEILAEIIKNKVVWAAVSLFSDGACFADCSERDILPINEGIRAASEAALRLWFKVKGIEVKE